MRKAPTLGALIFSAAAAICAAVQLNDVPAGGSTAQAVAMGAGFFMIVLGGIAGWICGSSARALVLAGKPRHARSVVILAAALLALVCGMFRYSHNHALRLEHLRAENLTRCGVGANPNTPPATLDELAKDGKDSVRLYVSLNPSRRKP